MSNGIRFPIGVKLSIIISLILAVSLSLITILVARLVSDDVRLTAENNNWTMNRWSAATAENVLAGYREKSLFLIRSLDAVSREKNYSSNDDETETRDSAMTTLTSRFFRLNTDISCVAFIGEEGRTSGIVTSERFTPWTATGGGASQLRENLSRWLDNQIDNLGLASAGKTLLFNAGKELNFPCMAMLFPLPREEGFGFSGAGAVFFLPTSIEESINSAAAGTDNITLLVSSASDILIQPEGFKKSDENDSAAKDNADIIRQVLGSDTNAMQTVLTAQSGERYYVAYERLRNIDAAVITQIKQKAMITRVHISIASIITISAVILLLSVFFMAMYSRTITLPLNELIGGVKEIENGNYEPNLKVKTSDEIGALTESFIAMGRGLANFERFTNKQVVALARKESLGRTGEKRVVTVCFTMIQNYKTLTFSMNPQRLINFVNTLLSALVPCITKTGGLVDKFLTQDGLVIMCLWGAAKTSGNPVSDAYNCIRSTLMMRNALKLMNMKRLSEGEPGAQIKMGCGINTGEVVAGQMGSEERMEYTVIGDTVNLAARIEEPNEAFDTDILITENTHKYIGKLITTEEMGCLEVKGKSKPLRVFSVVNIKNYYGPSTMQEVRQLWQM